LFAVRRITKVDGKHGLEPTLCAIVSILCILCFQLLIFPRVFKILS